MTDDKPKPSPEISAFFRELQKKGVATKLARSTPEQRRRHALKMNRARWSKKISPQSRGE